MSAFPELDHFLERHPDIRHVDVFLNDLNTVERGKRIEREGLERVFAEGMLLPGSLFALDVLGGTIQATGLGSSSPTRATCWPGCSTASTA
jgi:glutamine synthetase